MRNYFSTFTIRRLLKESKEISSDKNPWYTASPLEDDIFEWHFSFRGAPDSEFEGGIYHGKILFPHDFPNSPPDIMFLTPNGRFETGTKICLSITHYHKETWQPCFSVRTILLGLSSFMTTPGLGAVGSIEWSKAERIRAAKDSIKFKCEKCGTHNMTALPSVDENARYKDYVKPDESLLIEFSSSSAKGEHVDYLSLSQNDSAVPDGTEDQNSVQMKADSSVFVASENTSEMASQTATTTNVNSNTDKQHNFADSLNTTLSAPNVEQLKSLSVKVDMIMYTLLTLIIIMLAQKFVDVFIA